MLTVEIARTNISMPVKNVLFLYMENKISIRNTMVSLTEKILDLR